MEQRKVVFDLTLASFHNTSKQNFFLLYVFDDNKVPLKLNVYRVIKTNPLF